MEFLKSLFAEGLKLCPASGGWQKEKKGKKKKAKKCDKVRKGVIEDGGFAIWCYSPAVGSLSLNTQAVHNRARNEKQSKIGKQVFRKALFGKRGKFPLLTA